MLNLTFASWDHDRAMPLHTGEVVVPGVELESHILPTSKLFPIAVQEARFDLTELSVSSYVLQLSRGESAYTAVPVFFSRAFRHNGFFTRPDTGIRDLRDLAGRVVGVPEYQMTAALWMRGILADEYGVTPEQIRWRTGALDQGVRRERLALNLPDEIEVVPIDEETNLQQLLLGGAIDAIMSPKPPALFDEGDPRIVRVVDDFETVEQEYYARTGFFPIMHVLAVRKTIAEGNPWLPQALYDAAVTARDIAMKRIRDVSLGGANRLTLPWLRANLEATINAMGEDYWSYGFSRNRTELETICRYSQEQHLSARRLRADELFHPSVLET
ncbi:MAG: ABC transporter substrate-binding protein [Alkalispirochaeta sp.]